MLCGPTRVVNININRCGGFMPFTPYMPVGGFAPWSCGFGWGMFNPVNVFGYMAGAALGNCVFRGVTNIFNRMA